MKCNYCGADNKEGAKFCASCGAELKEKKKAPKKEEIQEEKVEVKTEPIKTTTPEKVTDGKSTASLVLGICSLVVWCLTFPLSLIGLILGIASKERSGKRTAGIVINAIGLVLSVIFIIICFCFWTFTMAVVDAAMSGENVYKVIEEIEKEAQEEKVTPAITTTKTVGSDYYGYVKVPNSWVKFQDVDNSDVFQYTDIGEGGYIITLNTYEETTSPYTAANNVKNHIVEEGNTATVKAAYLANYKYLAYKVEAKYTDGTYFDAYLFNADGKLHYVAIEGPDNTNDSFDIPNTFSLTK